MCMICFSHFTSKSNGSLLPLSSIIDRLGVKNSHLPVRLLKLYSNKVYLRKIIHKKAIVEKYYKILPYYGP